MGAAREARAVRRREDLAVSLRTRQWQLSRRTLGWVRPVPFLSFYPCDCICLNYAITGTIEIFRSIHVQLARLVSHRDKRSSMRIPINTDNHDNNTTKVHRRLLLLSFDPLARVHLPRPSVHIRGDAKRSRTRPAASHRSVHPFACYVSKKL